MVENEHDKTGKIYICYQGVGKSSTVDEDNNYIDLESSCFKDDNGNRYKNWFIYYVNTAFDLASQGHDVFISSHEIVRERVAYMAKNFYRNIDIIVIYPSIDLKDAWIRRLKKRFSYNPTNKNKLAWLNALDRFENNIAEMKLDADKYGFGSIVINTVDYRLLDLLNECKQGGKYE